MVSKQIDEKFKLVMVNACNARTEYSYEYIFRFSPLVPVNFVEKNCLLSSANVIRLDKLAR